MSDTVSVRQKSTGFYRKLKDYSEGKSAWRTTFISSDGTRTTPELLTREQFMERCAALSTASPALTYDSDIDTLGIHLSSAKAIRTDEVTSGVLVDFDQAGNVVTVEILDVTRRLNLKPQHKRAEGSLEVTANRRDSYDPIKPPAVLDKGTQSRGSTRHR